MIKIIEKILIKSTSFLPFISDHSLTSYREGRNGRFLLRKNFKKFLECF